MMRARRGTDGVDNCLELSLFVRVSLPQLSVVTTVATLPWSCLISCGGPWEKVGISG